MATRRCNRDWVWGGRFQGASSVAEAKLRRVRKEGGRRKTRDEVVVV